MQLEHYLLLGTATCRCGRSLLLLRFLDLRGHAGCLEKTFLLFVSPLVIRIERPFLLHAQKKEEESLDGYSPKFLPSFDSCILRPGGNGVVA